MQFPYFYNLLIDFRGARNVFVGFPHRLGTLTYRFSNRQTWL